MSTSAEDGARKYKTLAANTALVIGVNIALLAVFRLGITGYLLSVAAADALSALLLAVKKRLWRELTVNISPALFRQMLAYSIPLVPPILLFEDKEKAVDYEKLL